MGLDMYLHSRKKLTDYEKQSIEVAKERMKENEKLIAEIYEETAERIGKESLTRYNVEDQKGNGILESYEDLPYEIYMDIRERAVNLVESTEQLKRYRAKIKAQEDIIESMISRKQLGYWRKHADLNQLLTEFYYDRGGQGEFNCEELILSKEDCEHIRDTAQAILNGEKTVPKGDGFLWGVTGTHDWEDTISVFQSALDTVDFENEEVVYYCWY